MAETFKQASKVKPDADYLNNITEAITHGYVPKTKEFHDFLGTAQKPRGVLDSLRIKIFGLTEEEEKAKERRIFENEMGTKAANELMKQTLAWRMAEPSPQTTQQAFGTMPGPAAAVPSLQPPPLEVGQQPGLQYPPQQFKALMDALPPTWQTPIPGATSMFPDRPLQQVEQAQLAQVNKAMLEPSVITKQMELAQPPGLIKTSPGETLYDPTTKKSVFTAPEKSDKADTEILEVVGADGKPARVVVNKQTGVLIKEGLPGAPPKQPLVTIDQRQEDEFAKELGKEQAKQLVAGRTAAEESVEMLNTIKMGRELLASPMITGFGAETLVTIGQGLKQAGWDVGGDAVANTQAYSAAMAQNVGKIIKQFGAGSGLSDADRGYAEKMAAGKVTLEKKALEKIISINEKAARNVIRMHNKKAKGIKTNIPLLVEEPPEFKSGGTQAGGWSIKPVK